jgi:hypothetical protein
MQRSIRSIVTRDRRSSLAAAAISIVFGLGSLALAAHAGAAPVVVTPGNLQGWTLADGSSGTSPAKITGAQPFDGNGSIEFDINASNQQPLAAYGFASPVRFGDLVGSNTSFGYSYFDPTGTQPNASPTIRLLLTGLSGVTQPGGRTDGSLGWYLNGAADSTWHTDLFTMTSGDFFFRVGGVGQEANDCTSTGLSFDDRRQTLAQWAATCNGGGGTANIDNALVVGIEIDWGTFVPSAGAVSAYADRVNFNIGRNVGDFNFETTAAVPEPTSIALMLLALGLAGATRMGSRRQFRVA